MRLRADLLSDQKEVGFCYLGSVNSITIQDEYSNTPSSRPIRREEIAAEFVSGHDPRGAARTEHLCHFRRGGAHPSA